MGLGGMSSPMTALAVLAAPLVVTSAFADISVTAIDSGGKVVDMARSRASIERTPPERAAGDQPTPPTTDPDAIRFVLSGREGELPRGVMVVASDPSGAKLDEIELTISDGGCPGGVGPVCRSTPLVRTVADDIDRNHPLVRDRSIRAEVGGTLSILSGGRPLGAIRVGGPRLTPVGPIERLRGNLRVIVVRDRPKGSPPFGSDEAGAKVLARRQVSLANSLWGQC